MAVSGVLLIGQEGVRENFTNVVAAFIEYIAPTSA